MRRSAANFLAAALLAGAVVLPAPAAAQSFAGLVANQPAATLLLPYFEVDLGDPAGADTVFSVNNASASAGLARVTVWSDLAVPVFGFNIYLTGYDVQTISMRRLLAGRAPATASAGQDPTDAISPHGPFSQDINFATCNGNLPPAPLGAADVAGVRAALTGRASSVLGGSCAGVNRGDRRARGFVTIDDVVQCSALLPSDSLYFDTVIGNRNLYWGEFFYLDPPGGRSAHHVGAPLVAIRADAADPETSVAGQYTHYGRLVGWDASDNRQPLGSAFAARFLHGRGFATGTSLVVWRDPTVNQGPFACGAYPAWYRLGMEEFVAFDEQEEAAAISGTTAFGAAAQKRSLFGRALSMPARFGWVYADFDATVAGSPNPPEDPAADQAWVLVLQDARGRFSTGHPATLLTGAGETGHTVKFAFP